MVIRPTSPLRPDLRSAAAASRRGGTTSLPHRRSHSPKLVLSRSPIFVTERDELGLGCAGLPTAHIRSFPSSHRFARKERFMRALKRILFVVSWLVILPTSAHAQATLSGVVRDTSGAVLPGVTVEAASPVLIEKTRTAVT